MLSCYGGLAAWCQCVIGNCALLEALHIQAADRVLNWGKCVRSGRYTHSPLFVNEPEAPPALYQEEAAHGAARDCCEERWQRPDTRTGGRMAHAAPLLSANPIQSSERFGPLTVRVTITHASQSIGGRW